MHNSFFFYLASITLKPYTIKKLFFTAVALIAFSGFAMANNESKTVRTVENSQVSKIEKIKTNNMEGKDVWFCYKASESSSYNFMTQETTITTTYHCTWYSLAAE